MEILVGHVSEATAHICDDYPYGRRLRCKRRCWLEKGRQSGASGGQVAYRFVAQTSNPRLSDAAGCDVWNKPKRSTYAAFAAVMYLDDDGHMAWAGGSVYWDAADATAFLEKWREGLTAEMIAAVAAWCKIAKARAEKWAQAHAVSE